ncbi:MAG: fatty acid desaturase [Proteobacteria bacterium]|nr:fatty acid desaturase [Pseudomonadota bacterium]
MNQIENSPLLANRPGVPVVPYPSRDESLCPVDDTISWSEVERHNSNDDCWIVVNGFVYDITAWLKSHPGGSIPAILAGDNASAMVTTHHRKELTRYLKRYCVGRIESESYSLERDMFFIKELKRRVFAALREARASLHPTWRSWSEVTATALLWFGCWFCTYFIGWWPFAIGMGLASCSLVGSFAHEHAHGLLIRAGARPGWKARVASTLWSIFFPAMFERHFQYEHFRHHEQPMIPDHDYEVLAVAPFIRLAESIPWRPIHRYQHRIAPLVYAFYISIQMMSGLLRITPYFARRKLSRDRAFIFENYVSPVISIVVHFVIPLALVGFWKWLVCCLIFNAVWQCATYFVAAVVHMTDSAPERTGSWVAQVCQNTCDVHCGRFHRWLSGGFNFQIEHHLLPGIPREHLPFIAPIVQKTCEEFGFRYKVFTRFGDYHSSHYAMLVALAQRPGGNMQ